MGAASRLEDSIKGKASDLEDSVKGIGSKIDDKILQPVKNTVEAIVEDPRKLAGVALAVAFPGAGAALGSALGLGTTAAAQVVGQALLNTALNGGDVKSAVLSAAIPLVGREVASNVAQTLAKSGIEGSLNDVITRATTQGATAAVLGQDPKTAFLMGGVSAAVPAVTKEIPGFNDLPDFAKQSITKAITAELTGRDPSQAAIDSVINSGIKLANDYIKDYSGLTGAIPSGIFGGGGKNTQPQQPERPAQGGTSVPNINQTVDDIVIGDSRKSLSDLSAQELADIFSFGYAEEEPAEEQGTQNPYAEVEVKDLGFGSVDYGAKQDMSFGRAFALARASGADTFEWNGKPYTTELASSPAASKSPAYDAIGGGRGGQGGPTAEELARYVARGGAEPTAAELAAASKPYVGYPGFSMDPKMGDINQVADPKTLAFISGVLGQSPDEQGFSVMHPDIAGIRSAGGAGYYSGIGAQVAAPLAKGISSLGSGIKSLLGESGASGQGYKNLAGGAGDAWKRAESMGVGDPAFFTPNNRQFQNALMELSYNPKTRGIADTALDLLGAGRNTDAFKIIESNPLMMKALQSEADRLGYGAISDLPYSTRFMDRARYGTDLQGNWMPQMPLYPTNTLQNDAAGKMLGLTGLRYAEGGMAEAAPEMSTDELIELLLSMRQN